MTDITKSTASRQLVWMLAIGGGLVAGMPHLRALLGERAAPLLQPALMIALVLAATVLLRRAGQGWGDVGLRRPPGLGRAIAVVLGGYVVVVAAALAVMGLLLPALGVAPDPVGRFAEVRGDLGAYLYWLAIAWTGAAIGEELVFRGFIQPRLEQAWGPARGAVVFALVLQALLFGLAHASQGPGGMILTGVTGLIIGLAYLVSGRNLVVCILLHALVDTVSLTAIFLGAA